MKSKIRLLSEEEISQLENNIIDNSSSEKQNKKHLPIIKENDEKLINIKKS